MPTPKADKGLCPFGKPAYKNKAEAERATGRKAKRCGRCRQWHAA